VINLLNSQDIKFEINRIDTDPPKEITDKLLRISHFERAYAEDGCTRVEYNTHSALATTAQAFSKATQEIEEIVNFAGTCLEGGGGAANPAS
jgi:hypothetical protein